MNKQPGFTLVELLVAFALFLIIAASFNGVLKACQRSAQTAEQLAKQTYQLQSQLEELKLAPFANLASFNGQAFASGQGKIIIASLQPDLYMIEVQLTRAGNSKPLILATLRGKY